MQIHDVHTAVRKARKRIGRGGKRGTYSGRGNKGQKARSGAHVNPLFEGGRSSLVERLKKVRGFKSPHAKKPYVKLSDIARAFVPGDTISREALVAKKLVSKDALVRGVKVIGTGTLPAKLSFHSSIDFSDGARAILEQSGGTVSEPPAENNKQ